MTIIFAKSSQFHEKKIREIKINRLISDSFIVRSLEDVPQYQYLPLPVSLYQMRLVVDPPTKLG